MEGIVGMKITAVRTLVVLLIFSIVFVTASDTDAAERLRVGIIPFESKAENVTQEQANVITGIFYDQLIQAKDIAIIDRESLDKVAKEQKLSMSGLVDPLTAVEVGRIIGLQYVLLGSVTQLELQKVSGAMIYGLMVASGQTVATIDLRIVDVATSEVLVALRGVGTSQSDFTGFSEKHIGYANTNFTSAQERALSEAAYNLAHDVITTLGSEGHHVIGVTADGVIIDIKAPAEGALFLVYAKGEEILDMDGKIVGRRKLPIAVIKVQEIENNHSIAAVISEGGSANLIHRGDGIEPISSAKAKKLAEGKKFASRRPSASNAMMEQMLKSDGAHSVTPYQERAQTAEISDNPSSKTEASSQSTASKKSFENESTDPAKVIACYGLSPTEANIRRIIHLGAKNAGGKVAYDKYVELVNSYDGDYLAAFCAGEIALGMGKNAEARKWFDKALSINPDYKPALEKIDNMTVK
jgi:hypothetical protein